MPDDGVLQGDSGGAQDASRGATDPQRLGDVVELADADLLGAQAYQVLATAQVQGEQGACAEIDGHARQLVLGELEPADRTAELFALAGVLQRCLERATRGAHHSPQDAVAGLVQAGQRADEATDLWEDGSVGQTYPVQDQLTGHGGSQ